MKEVRLAFTAPDQPPQLIFLKSSHNPEETPDGGSCFFYPILGILSLFNILRRKKENLGILVKRENSDTIELGVVARQSVYGPFYLAYTSNGFTNGPYPPAAAAFARGEEMRTIKKPRDFFKYVVKNKRMGWVTIPQNSRLGRIFEEVIRNSHPPNTNLPGS